MTRWRNEGGRNAPIPQPTRQKPFCCRDRAAQFSVFLYIKSHKRTATPQKHLITSTDVEVAAGRVSQGEQDAEPHGFLSGR